MFQGTRLARFTVIAMAMAMPLAVFGGPIGDPSGGGSSIQWTVTAGSHDRIELRVVDPYGDVYAKSFKYGSTVIFRLADLREVIDGEYAYELVLIPIISAEVARKLELARATGDDSIARRVMRENGLNEIEQSGGFRIDRGEIVSLQGTESDANDASSPATNATSRGAGAETTATRPWKVANNDFVIADDLIVQGSTCTGFDCVNGEVFSFDTLRLKENNLRIHFDDTSTTAGFPANDWRIIANDSASGGQSKLSIEDSTGAKTPMTIRAGASTNSIFVDSTGRVGFRTSTPVLDLHVATSNTPAIRLEQNNSGGFTAQTWDIAANEAHFFIRDVTSGSTLPFRIRPGAPTSSIDISADGDVGIGTATTNSKLNVLDGTAARTAMRIQNTSATGNSAIEYLDNSGNIDLFFGVQNSSSTTRMNSLNSNPIVMLVNSAERLRVDTTGATVTGDFTVTGVKNFAMVDPVDPKRAIYYAALEGPEAGTYYRGSAKTIDGEVVIELPAYFASITEADNITVQLTPQGTWGQIYVAEKARDRIVVRVADGQPDLAFDYFVQGVRCGYGDYQVVRDNNLTR